MVGEDQLAAIVFGIGGNVESSESNSVERRTGLRTDDILDILGEVCKVFVA